MPPDLRAGWESVENNEMKRRTKHRSEKTEKNHSQRNRRFRKDETHAGSARRRPFNEFTQLVQPDLRSCEQILKGTFLTDLCRRVVLAESLSILQTASNGI